MRYLTFTEIEATTYETCFLVSHLNTSDITRFYIDPHLADQVPELLAYALHKGPKRTPVKEQRAFLDELLHILESLAVKYLVVCDAEYFKTLTKSPSADAALGYVLNCAHPGFEHMKVTYCPNSRAVFHDPANVKEDIRIALSALKADQQGAYIAPGTDVIKFAAYPDSVAHIEMWLQRLLDMNCDLTGDIEAFSLKPTQAGIGTISFSWTKYEGISFPVDLLEDPTDQLRVRQLLKDFFYQFLASGRTMIWHNISYDVTVLIYQLFMKSVLDTAGLLEGMRVLLTNWDDTKLITYLATNTCAGNTLGLKAQAQEFAGNYAVDDIKDIRNIPLPNLLQYNLIDTLSTWYVLEKHWDTMVADQQLDLYQSIFKSAILDIIQMQLTGLPIDMARVKQLAPILQAISDHATTRMANNQLVQSFIYEWRLSWIEKENTKLKTKTRSYEEAEAKVSFNPNSNPQLQTLLYDEHHLGLPVLDYTEKKNPASGGDTLEKLINHTQDPEIKDFLEALIDFKAIDKILTSFLPAFLDAVEDENGWHWLLGYFNLGGTVSGRLSSSDPNLQNLPANVYMKVSDWLLDQFPELRPYMKGGKLSLGKLLKSCFVAPLGHLLIGLDFASLEDRISALTTKDPNKLKVYTDGYDGHCLRAYSYFTNQMPDIDPDQVESINTIEDAYPDLRQDSKAPTFALTYQGTFLTLMNNCGFSMELAKHIEAQYHDLYKVSDAWVAARIAEAGQCGYVTVAFGLRVRTPLLEQVILGNRKTPYEAAAEGRTAGNALGQSYGLLNSRAASEFMGKVRTSEFRLQIRPCAHIHDAQYYVISDDMAVLLFVNQHLVKAVEWQEDPLIAHPEVKLGGSVAVFYPDWASPMNIPNHASAENIKELARKHLTKYVG